MKGNGTFGLKYDVRGDNQQLISRCRMEVCCISLCYSRMHNCKLVPKDQK